MSKITRYAIPALCTWAAEIYSFELNLSPIYSVLGVGSIKEYKNLDLIDAWIDVLETDNEKKPIKFIVVPVGIDWINPSGMRRRCYGTFIGACNKQCYVFEGGMIGV